MSQESPASARGGFNFRTDPVPPHFDGIVHCQVIELAPPNALAYSWRGASLDTVMRWNLSQTVRDGVSGTLLIGVHSGFNPDDPAQLGALRRMSGGWHGPVATRLGRVLTELAQAAGEPTHRTA